MSQKHQEKTVLQANLESPEASPTSFLSLPRVVRSSLIYPNQIQSEPEPSWMDQLVKSSETNLTLLDEPKEAPQKIEYQFYFGDLAEQSKRPKETPPKSSKVIKTKPTIIRVSIDGAWSGAHKNSQD